MGISRGSSSQHNAHCSQSTCKFTQRKRLGEYHRENHINNFKQKRTCCVPLMGFKRNQFCSKNCKASFGSYSPPPKSTFSIQRILWMQTFLKSKWNIKKHRTRTNRLANRKRVREAIFVGPLADSTKSNRKVSDVKLIRPVTLKFIEYNELIAQRTCVLLYGSLRTPTHTTF